MAIQRISPEPTKDEVIDFHIDGGKMFEKNWSPIAPIGDDSFLFARLIDPSFQIVQCKFDGSCSKEAATTTHIPVLKRLADQFNIQVFHLATGAIRIDDTHFGAIFHGKYSNPANSYNMRYYVFPYIFEVTHPWRITSIATVPLELPVPEGHPVHEYTIIYACGLKYVDGRVVISYSVDDSIGGFIVMSVQDVFSNMEDVVLQ